MHSFSLKMCKIKALKQNYKWAYLLMQLHFSGFDLLKYIYTYLWGISKPFFRGLKPQIVPNPTYNIMVFLYIHIYDKFIL